MSCYFQEQDLLKSPLIKRAAYADRTAWLMAELSRLVYEPLPCERQAEATAKAIREQIAAGRSDSQLIELVESLIARVNDEQCPITANLSAGGLSLMRSFSVGGTQAMLVSLDERSVLGGMNILVFRGTQMTLGDIHTDIKANLVDAPGGGRVHRGFLEAFQAVEGELREALSECEGNVPLFITGHSLGAALALVATRYLNVDSEGATYTFGSPRVGDELFFRSLRTPVYRVVHAADGVTRVPLGYGFEWTLHSIRYLPINGSAKLAHWLRNKFSGYTHYGNMVFITDKVESKTASTDLDTNVSHVLVKKSPNYLWLLTRVIKRLITTKFSAAKNDHSIDGYSTKLAQYASHRNKASLD